MIMSNKLFTRADYLSHMCTHRQYYAQFVLAGTKVKVLKHIGLTRLLPSAQYTFEDIPLHEWDRLTTNLPGSSLLLQATGIYTLSDGVCLLKEAAMQLVEEYEKEHKA